LELRSVENVDCAASAASVQCMPGDFLARAARACWHCAGIVVLGTISGAIGMHVGEDVVGGLKLRHQTRCAAKRRRYVRVTVVARMTTVMATAMMG
jgi:hypothetical protein